MRHAIILTAVGFVHFPMMGVAADPPPSRIEVAKVLPPREGGVNQPYWGSVTEVTKESITVQYEKDEPKKFVASETLALGKIPMEPRPNPNTNHKYVVPAPCMYRLADVKVGDDVSIRYSHIGGVSICDHICIHKRPGGRIPPLPEEAEALRRGPQRPGDPPRLFIPYHEYWNAYWDLEDKGIPFPEKFGYMRRWPVAPEPREVTVPRIPNAEP
jgi:hypothetical protein